MKPLKESLQLLTSIRLKKRHNSFTYNLVSEIRVHIPIGICAFSVYVAEPKNVLCETELG